MFRLLNEGAMKKLNEVEVLKEQKKHTIYAQYNSSGETRGMFFGSSYLKLGEGAQIMIFLLARNC